MYDPIGKALRTGQTYFPFLADPKARFQRAVRRATRRPFERDFRALPMLGIGADSLCLDIGANRGQTIDAIRMVAPGAVVEAFEPNSLLVERLRHRHRHHADVRVRTLALGDEPGFFTLFVPSYNGYLFDGLASLDEASASQWLEGAIYGYDPAKLQITNVECEVVRLDDLHLSPEFVKVDVQGYEFHVLMGGRDTLDRFGPAILVETPGEDVVDLLADLKYRPYAFEGGRLLPDRLGSLNTFFLR